MTEQEYILVTDLTLIREAKKVLTLVMECDLKMCVKDLCVHEKILVNLIGNLEETEQQECLKNDAG